MTGNVELAEAARILDIRTVSETQFACQRCDSRWEAEPILTIPLIDHSWWQCPKGCNAGVAEKLERMLTFAWRHEDDLRIELAKAQAEASILELARSLE
jgi:hypothetical protein